MTRSGVRSFLTDADGSFSILASVLSVVVVGFTALAVDVGSIVYWQRRLQGVTDTAALAATFDFNRSEEIALSALAANGPAAATLENEETGLYVDDPSVDADSRFTPGASVNAVRLSTTYDVPVYFMQPFTGSPTVTVSAQSVAYNLPLAGISVGTALVDVDLVLVNELMNILAGVPFNLTLAEVNALDDTKISVFRLFDRLAASAGSQSTAMDQVMSSNVDLDTLAAAAASALTAQAQTPTSTETLAISALTRIAQQAGTTSPVQVSEFVTLGAHEKRAAVDMISNTNDALAVPAMALLAGYMHAAEQDTLLDIDEIVTIPGLATVTVDAVVSRSAIGGGPQGVSAIGPVGEYAYSSKGRVRLTISLLQPIAINLGLIHLSLPATIPVVADIAYGDANISGISCGSDVHATADVAVTGQSGAVDLYVGSVTDNELTDMLTPLAPDPVMIINTPLVKVTGSSDFAIAESGVETLHFGWSDIEAGTVKTIDGLPPLTPSLVQLSNNLALTVNNAPIGVGGLVSSLLRTQVSAVLAALGPELDAILESIGLKAGSIDVRATGLRCGIPALVD